jgi:hypothetical protein
MDQGSGARGFVILNEVKDLNLLEITGFFALYENNPVGRASVPAD